MKVIVSIFVATFLAAQPVLAQEVFGESASAQPEELSQVVELDEGAMSLFDLQATQGYKNQFSHDPDRGDVLRGIIIGAIIGAIAAEHLERDHRYDHRNVTCYAKNLRGHVFRAQGRRPRAVQARAMDKCYRESRYCRELGCR